MIGALRGRILDCADTEVYLETPGGAIYEVHVSRRTLGLCPAGADVLLYTSLIVRENEMYLIGFSALGEKKLFEMLITAKGIGPKQGLKILDALSPSELRLALVSGDTKTLAQIKGVGARKAEQMVLDLRGKMEKDVQAYEGPLPPADKKKTDILLTMRALGYTDAEIKKPLDAFFEHCNPEDSIESLASAFLRSIKS